ncbi:MAG: hypothetical protein HQL74_07375 [Magnetococcales bacterium]|nr:hypothetical protein [Magnetococcales bacterium]
MSITSPHARDPDFTPGPWKMVGWKYENRGPIVEDCEGCAIANAYPGPTQVAQVANANLIATAPDLYYSTEELTSLVSAMVAFFGAGSANAKVGGDKLLVGVDLFLERWHQDDGGSATLARAVAALAKARGEAK